MNKLPVNIISYTRERKLYARLFFCFVLLSLAIRYYNHCLLHQLQSPVISYAGYDVMHWFFNFLRLPAFITHNFEIALSVDALLVITAIMVIIFPLKNGFAICFTILYFIYLVCYNNYRIIHAHSMAGILFMSFIFWCRGPQRFYLVWQGVRYIIIFFYADAFLFKIYHGSFFATQQGILNMQGNLGYVLYGAGPQSFTAGFYAFFLSHPAVVKVGYLITLALEGCMMVGFFTKRFDRFLFFIPIVVHTMGYIFIDVSFIEMLPVSLVFTKWNRQSA